ncbi:MAG: cyclic beta 1-2 glucan synthetase [Candidatus Omnitrophica bacterium]|nr:cyclic beta 1-2 glucan synthetase [Candidatus Omnitrophota bacterium]
MKIRLTDIKIFFSHLLRRLRGKILLPKHMREEPPLRSELFSSEQMKQYGKTLARLHKLTTERSSLLLLTRLTENEMVLGETHALLTEAVKAKRLGTPAGEWLLDNFYLIEEQVRTAKRHLPKSYHRELPLLMNGPSQGLPRVYDIALEMVAHGDGRIDLEILNNFIKAYQQVTLLNLGELWAIPIMLRLALIENLRRVAARITVGRMDQNLADFWADQMAEVAAREPKTLVLIVADMARSTPPMSSSFVAELTRRLQGHSPSLALPLTWINQWLAESGLTIEHLVNLENQQQAANQVSISNSIGSLRLLSAMDWREFVETMSIVEKFLLKDPAGFYAQMDFATRDRYRHVVENIAKRSGIFESEVAQKAVQLASEAAGKNGVSDRTAHVGFYLIDKGLSQLEQAVRNQFSIIEKAYKLAQRFALLLYLGAVAVLTFWGMGVLWIHLYGMNVMAWKAAAFGVFLIVAMSQLALELVNYMAMSMVKPQVLPRMDFSKGIPSEFLTLIVVPTMLTSSQNIERLIEALEVRFLANQDEQLHFGLLTDFQDAPQETMPDDDALLRLTQEKIVELNSKYKKGRPDIFFLFHRPRSWNPCEGIWMGYERKRGKLADLNGLLRGGSQEKFLLIVGDLAVLKNVKYIITLDTDTQLPRDCARQLVETMAHPLNRARYDEQKQCVCEGYGILQPRVSTSLAGANRSFYARLYAGEPGIDPYTRTVSDVYQDLFGEGSFIGKGIYDLDIFERACKGRFPEGKILSHDLWEGCYARSGLLSNVELYEENLFRYSTDVRRRHRWIRGDWQLLGWLWSKVPSSDGHKQKNTLSFLSQWKIFDNLRRSLVPFALIALLLMSWTIIPSPWHWTCVVFEMIFFPPLLISFLDALHKSKDVFWKQHLKTVFRAAAGRLAQRAFTVACLPYEAFFTLDAIVRTVVRMLITHKRFLEWNLYADTDGDSNDLIRSFLLMWIAPVTAVSVFIYLAGSAPHTLMFAGPVLLLWAVSPACVWWLSRLMPRREVKLSANQLFFLRKLSRKIWDFFETFVGQEDHWLPPDNYQETRMIKISHRTSPTNIGLALLANLSAYDFGIMTAQRLLERTENTFRSMAGLKRFRGHFFNWYDTQSLQPLLPNYISTVDSGNLAGFLLTLRPGLLALCDDKILGERWLESLKDTFLVLVDSIGDMNLFSTHQLEKDLESADEFKPATLEQVRLWLEAFGQHAEEFHTKISLSAEAEAIEWTQKLVQQCRHILDDLIFLVPKNYSGITGIPTLRELTKVEGEISTRALKRISDIERLVRQAGDFAQMEYDFLYDVKRKLLSIGYYSEERKLDSGFYDLLASEARLCYFTAIAQGQVPSESWFALGRLLTTSGGKPTLLSWSGSMFEYLMPLVVMPTYENTLLGQTYQAAVGRQIEYGKQFGVAWGISESGYNAIDANLNYQYRAFGVPGLGFKRGLTEDLVIAPYASLLALMVTPEPACLNLQRLACEGMMGQYGLYEAVDYTPSRRVRGRSSTILRSFLAHHQGMSLLALAYVLLDHPMQKRFRADPLFQANMLLLQERIPKSIPFYIHVNELSNIRALAAETQSPVRILKSPHTQVPEVQLLSNGRYHVMVTNAGGGYSRWKDMAVTRWREDTTCDNWGVFCYIRDIASGKFWSTAYQPTHKQPENYEVIFSQGRAEFRRRDYGLETHVEIVVSPEDDIELRRVRITNRSRGRRVIEVTSYSEVVLAPDMADALHPMFSNLFVQTEIIKSKQAILCSRRPRSVTEQEPWMFHLMSVHDAEIQKVSYETDRMQFIGRGYNLAEPYAMTQSHDLSGSQGSVLDPVTVIRGQMSLEPEQTVIINMVYGMGETRDKALSLIEKYHDWRIADRVFELSWTHSQVVLRQINATETDAQLFGHLAGFIIYAHASLRADPAVLIQNRRGQSGLWGSAISGDLPMVILQIGDLANVEIVRQMVQAHAYWRLKGLAVDLVIWNEALSGYRQLLQEQIMGLISATVQSQIAHNSGEIFVRPAEQISDEERILFQSVARAIISDRRGTLANQIYRHNFSEFPVEQFIPVKTFRPAIAPSLGETRHDLILFNGLGGFTPDGREYVICLSSDQVTPAPWVNVLANAHFGTIISENGLAYTWSENAHEFRLSPWNNDPVNDLTGEAFYLRDEETGQVWSPAPQPVHSRHPYLIRHGFGYSVFEHDEGGLHSELWVYVALESPVKFSVLKIRNISGRPRRLSATGYVEWVLGDLRSKTVMHVHTEVDPINGAIYARNFYNSEFSDIIAFFSTNDMGRTICADRAEFLGRNGSIHKPDALLRAHLSGRTGSALDPCAAIQVPFELADGEEREIVFTLGAGHNVEQVKNLVRNFCGSSGAQEALDAVNKYWTHTIGAVQVETPDSSLNVLANGWLIYQTLACRLWGRSGYYQSGGAFGFRDQLQDVMALNHCEPRLMREHLLLCASHQFLEGDVQHWWHPPSGRGVRTHCSDDYLWLVYATCHYVLSIGDTGVLDELVPFLRGRMVTVEEDSYYDLPKQSSEKVSLYEHCQRAIIKSLSIGQHGLPLMGSCDWNDGMNCVGQQGKGESVWLGFFLYDVLTQFIKMAQLRDDSAFVEICRAQLIQLKQNIEKNGWDGEWYRRAYFDDGALLGSAGNSECQIDSIAQSWSVLSGAADPDRGRKAMTSLNQRLVHRDTQIIQLLDPPFDKSGMNPGYIKGYVPGVRENGGQYTHAAIWAAMAFARLGDSRMAWELLDMINPVNHGKSLEEINIYKVEPYVVAADVYAVAPHVGRGGWTWYTGSAGWMYRLLLEFLLGLRLNVNQLSIEPCLPPEWKTFKIHYRYRDTLYHIEVSQILLGSGLAGVLVDGHLQENKMIELIDDHQDHRVEVRMIAENSQ